MELIINPLLRKRHTLQIEEAQRMLLPFIQTGEHEETALIDAYERYAASDIVSPYAFPHFTRSGMDGYAICSQDAALATSEDPILLEVIEDIPCGKVPIHKITEGFASRIMTGAQVPLGADAVIRLEMVEAYRTDGKQYISVTRNIRKGTNITLAGNEISEGTIIVERGQKLGAGEIALLATFGFSKVNVFKKPIVGILATGTELLGVEEAIEEGKIRDSNSYMLAALVKAAGGNPYMAGKVPDNAADAYQKLQSILQLCGVVITTGGVSVGDYDILVDIFAQWEGNMLFNKIAMRPGSPTTVGEWNGKLIFALSGNPGAAFVGFELLVRGVLAGMQGSNYIPHQFSAILTVDYLKIDAYTRFVRGISYAVDGKLLVSPVGEDKSSVVASIKDTNCLIVIPAGKNGIKAGESVMVIGLVK